LFRYGDPGGDSDDDFGEDPGYSVVPRGSGKDIKGNTKSIITNVSK
jgi:hypothetical protein